MVSLLKESVQGEGGGGKAEEKKDEQGKECASFEPFNSSKSVYHQTLLSQLRP